jgi:hypothetical protein
MLAFHFSGLFPFDFAFDDNHILMNGNIQFFLIDARNFGMKDDLFIRFLKTDRRSVISIPEKVIKSLGDQMIKEPSSTKVMLNGLNLFLLSMNAPP